MNTHVIIPAGGSGKRFGHQTKKQFLELNGQTILNRTIQCLLRGRVHYPSSGLFT